MQPKWLFDGSKNLARGLRAASRCHSIVRRTRCDEVVGVHRNGLAFRSNAATKELKVTTLLLIVGRRPSTKSPEIYYNSIMKWFALVCLFCAAVPVRFVDAITPGQIDTFQDGTTASWTNG